MRNQKALDFWTIGHFLLGLMVAFFLFPIVFWYGLFIDFEIGFVTAIGVFIVGVGWEYLENGFFKPRNIGKKILKRAIGEEMYSIDSWINCLTDVVFVMLGMIPILMIAYDTLPDFGLYFNWCLLPISIILIIFALGMDLIEEN